MRLKRSGLALALVLIASRSSVGLEAPPSVASLPHPDDDKDAVDRSCATGKSAEKVPVIDVSALMEPDTSYSSERWNETAAAIAAACEEWGFFHAINHGLSSALLRNVVSKGREMFALPKEVKAEIKRTEKNAFGWFDDELTKQTQDWKEGFDVGHVPAPELPPDHPSNIVAEGYNQWPSPEAVHDFKETMDAFYAGATTVSERILQGLASSLGLPGGHFDPFFQPHTSFLRLNYYPPCPEPCDSLSVNRHSDAGALTVLLQEDGVTSLQVNHQSTGRWVSIPPVEDALTINVGDMLQVWSNDRFRAPEHRVLSQTDRDRFSAPFFYNPAYHADIAPLPWAAAVGSADGKGEGEPSGDERIQSAVPANGRERQGSARYRSVNWGEFRLKRFAGDYADQSTEEVQISHYRL